MPVSLELDAMLTFSIDTPASGDAGPSHVSGTLRARGTHVELQSDDLMSIAGQPSRQAVRDLAAELARRGLTVHVRGSKGVIVTLGKVDLAPISRVLTRSRHMRIKSLGQTLVALRARRRSAPGAVTIVPPQLPPGTLWPPLPTMRGRSRRITTTHDPAGGGNPRLYLTNTTYPGGPIGVFRLPRGTTRIGSGHDVDLRLEGIDELQATIERTADDEYVLVARSTTVLSTVGGRQLPRQQLRTGSRIELGPWRMSYVRDEFADHGRPYGGRIGGELGHQRTQPHPTNRQGQGF